MVDLSIVMLVVYQAGQVVFLLSRDFFCDFCLRDVMASPSAKPHRHVGQKHNVPY